MFSASLENFSFRVQSTQPVGFLTGPSEGFPIKFVALDNRGQLIDEVTVTPGDPWLVPLLQLWEMARRSARQIDEKMARLQAELEALKKKSVG